MAVELMYYADQSASAIQEAATAGMQSLDSLIHQLSHGQRLDCRDLTDNTVNSFKKMISVLNRTGHARFRRGPRALPDPELTLSPPQQLSVHPHPPPPPPPPQKALTLDFTKPTALAYQTNDGSCSLSSGSSSFMSSLTTGDGSVSNGRQLISNSLLPPPVPTGKPPLSSSSNKKRCHAHSSASGERCHCSKRRKPREKRTVRVPAISAKVADIPADDHAWRKYGQKPIKGSPYPRGYYKCSSVKGCPARKHVERALDDPAMLIVTYEGEHQHASTAEAMALFRS